MTTLEIHTNSNALHDNLREILSRGKSPSLFFHFTTIPKDLPYHATILLVSPLKSWTARTSWRWLCSRSQYTSSVGDSRRNPIAAEVYLQAPSFMTSILPNLLPSIFTRLLEELFQSSMNQQETNKTNTTHKNWNIFINLACWKDSENSKAYWSWCTEITLKWDSISGFT